MPVSAKRRKKPQVSRRKASVGRPELQRPTPKERGMAHPQEQDKSRFLAALGMTTLRRERDEGR
jgi:hypothetical protein